MPPRLKHFRHGDYTIGWICAIAVEQEAAVAVLDETHPKLSVAHNDKNTYILGNIGPHNVVVCCLPPGTYGTTAATTVANHMISTFPEIRDTLLVGIGGGAPSRTTDIRLGDVVVSMPNESSTGVVQYNRGKKMAEGRLLRTGVLNRPSSRLLGAVGSLRTQHDGSRIPQILSEIQAQQPGKWMRPTVVDELFDSTYDHEEGNETCSNCDRTKLVPRGLRNGMIPVIHYGLIASDNQVMKHGRTRDKLQKELGVLCFEMEAAGIMNDMQPLVIRGICDYADSHKNKVWQSFAAATAAVYAKELLGFLPRRRRTGCFPPMALGIDSNSRHEQEKYSRQNGTCGWVLERTEFVRWREESQRTCSILWIFGRTGCGKTKVMSQIIDDLQTFNDTCLLYFYVDRSEARMSNSRVILLTLRDQILKSCAADEDELSTITEDTSLIDVERTLSYFLEHFSSPVYIVIDGLNELQEPHCDEVLRFLASTIERRAAQPTGILISSSSHDGRADLRLPQERVPVLEVTPQDTFNDIRAYVFSRMGGNLHHITSVERANIAHRITKRADGMFLWVALQLPNICRNWTVREALAAIDQLPLPGKIHEIYRRAYGRFDHLPPKYKIIVQTVMALLTYADGPLLAEAVWEALAVVMDESKHTDGRTTNPYPDLDELRKDHEWFIYLCGHLVKADGHPPTFRFSHSTIYDFFTNPGSGQISKDHHPLLSHLYLSYLASTKFSHRPVKEGPWAHVGPLENCIRDHPLLRSASARWAYHTRQAFEEGSDPNGINKGLLTLCENVDNMRLAFQVFLFTHHMKLSADLCYNHIVSYFGLSWFLDVLKGNQDLDVAVRDSSRLTPLHWAVQGQDPVAVAATTAKLLQHGADINAEDSKGWTPLHYAANCGNLAAVRILRRHGILKKDFQRQRSGTALIIAAFKGHHNIVKELVEAGADVTLDSKYGTAFQAAASSGYDKCIKALLKTRRQKPQKYFGDALQFVACNCEPGIVELLLKNGARVDDVSSQYGTAMQAAAMAYEDGNKETEFRKIFDILLEYGADVNKSGGLLGPALYIAASRGFTGLAELLIDRGAQVDLSGPLGTPFQAARDIGNQKMMRVLHQHGATILPPAPALPGNIFAQISSPSVEDKADDVRRFMLWKGLFALPLRLFKLAVAANNLPRIDFLLSNFRGVMTTAIDVQSVSMVEAFATQGEHVFKAVIGLASGKDSQERGVTNNGFIHRVIRKMTQAAVAIFQRAIRALKRHQVEMNERGPPIRMDSALSDLGGAHRDHFLVLDKLTQVAVNILGHAIKKQKSQDIVSVLSEAWVSALYEVVSESVLGIPMLERLIQVRAQELTSIFTRPEASHEEKMSDANNLAQVGVELLATALSRGRKYNHMAESLARLWIVALDDLSSIDAETGKSNATAILTIFTIEFQNGLDSQNLKKIKRWAEVGVEVLKEAVVDGKKYLVRLLADKWSTLWQKALGQSKRIDQLINEIMAGRVEEFGGYVRDGCIPAAKGLAGAGLAILRAALTQGHEAVEQMLVYNIVAVLQMALECGRKDMVEEIIVQHSVDFTAAALEAYQRSQPDQQDTAHLFNTATSLIVAAMERRFTKLLTMLAHGSLDVVGGIVNSDPNFLQDDITHRIRQLHDSNRSKPTHMLTRTFTAVTYLLQIALMERRNVETFGALIETCTALFDGLGRENVPLQYGAFVTLVEDERGKKSG